MMTGRQRLLTILSGRPPDRVAWTTLVDDTTRSAMPPRIGEMPVLDFYRHIGCDILQFGNYGLPRELRVPSPARLVAPPIETEWKRESDGLAVRTQKTPWGTLVATFRNGHPILHPVGTLDELSTLRSLWAASHYEEIDVGGASVPRVSFARAEAAIGDSGLYIPTLDPSPVQQLIEMDMGMASFYYLLQDHRAEVEALLDAMHACRVQEYEIVARRSPAPALMPVENTSTTLISPPLYRRYSLPQLRDFCRICRRHGKKAILHMCGHLKGLLPELAETGLDGINALTPPPVGDLPFEDALDALGDRLIILGGIFDGAVFQKERVTRQEIWRALDRLFTPRLRRAPFLLWLGADGLPTPLDRFLAVRDWVRNWGG
ncbi:MAG: hypothetical protein FJ291_12005 [Planctomycetes bacterium]|nr:hypothetical protein [Planctomycetota bacterium]